MEEPTISSVSELISTLATDVTPDNRPIWYRGHGIGTWKLRPTIFRKTSKKTEMDYLKEFKVSANLLVEPRPKDDYEWLFIMRHHYVPTRLLDWTESPLVATYFALEENKYDTIDGALWLLRPLELNRNMRELQDTSSLPTFGEDALMESYTTRGVSMPQGPNVMNPVAFLAPRNSARMVAQLSVFTISHQQDIPLEEVGKGKHVKKYIIPKESKQKLRKELGLLGITKFRLFPELSNIIDQIEGEK